MDYHVDIKYLTDDGTAKLQELMASNKPVPHSETMELFQEHMRLISETLEAEDERDAVQRVCVNSGLTLEDVLNDDWMQERFGSVVAFAVPYHTLGELLENAPVVRTETYIDSVETFFTEMGTDFPDCISHDVDAIENSGNFRIDYYVDKDFDSDRGMVLGCAFFCNSPMFVFQRAGRGLRDFEREFLISQETKEQFLDWTRQFRKRGDKKEYSLEGDDVGTELCFFYLHSIGDKKKSE